MNPAAAPGLDALDDRVKLTAALSTHFDPFAVLGGSLLDDDRVESIDALATVCDEVEVAGSGYRHWSMRPEARQHVLRRWLHAPTSERCSMRSTSRRTTCSPGTSATGSAVWT